MFSGKLDFSNITGTATPFQLSGRVEIVVEADVKL